MLAGWRDTQHSIRAATGSYWDDTYNLVSTTGVGTSISGGNARRSLRTIAKKLGIDVSITPYDLHHTAITLQSKLAYSHWNSPTGQAPASG